MARKKRHEEHESHERWLVSYADFITLLFAFFVVMYSTSSVNEGKMRVLSDSLVASFSGRNKSLAPIQIGKLVRSPYTDEVSTMTSPTDFILVAPPEAFGSLNERSDRNALEENEGFLGGNLAASVGGEGSVPEPGGATGGAGAGGADASGGEADRPFDVAALEADEASDSAVPAADMSSITEQVRASISPLIDLAQVALRQRQSWLEIELDSSMLFESGSARLSRRAIPLLSELSEVLKRFPNPIQVEGFTDNIPIQTLAFPSNWELSAARAASVVHLFTKRGVDPQRMVAVGYGEHRPAADNASAKGRARNRRVVVVIPADEDVRRLLNQQHAFEIREGGG